MLELLESIFRASVAFFIAANIAIYSVNDIVIDNEEATPYFIFSFFLFWSLFSIRAKLIELIKQNGKD